MEIRPTTTITNAYYKHQPLLREKSSAKSLIQSNSIDFTSLNILGKSKMLTFGANLQPHYEPYLRKENFVSPEAIVNISTEAIKRINQKPHWNIDKPNVWMVTAETSTFMYTGGLGDVGVELPEAFNKEYNKDGCKMTIVQPLYESDNILNLVKMGDNSYKYTNKALNKSIKLVDTGVKIEVPTHDKGKSTTVTVLKGTLNGTEYRFLRNEEYFGSLPNANGKANAYGLNKTGVGEIERFTFFSKATAKYIKELKQNNPADAPNVIDANDWHAAPIASELRYYIPLSENLDKKLAEEIRNIPIVYTVHNLSYQGWDNYNTPKFLNLLFDGYAKSILDNAYSPYMFNYERPSNPKSLLVGESYNAAIHGLALADVITPVSETYGKEIASKGYFGHDFVNLLSAREKAGSLQPIVNGGITSKIVPDGIYTTKINQLFNNIGIQDNTLYPYSNKTDPTKIVKLRKRNKENFVKLLQNGTLQQAFNVKSSNDHCFQDIDISKLDKTPILSILGRLDGQKGADIMVDSVRHALTQPAKEGQEKPLVVILARGDDAGKFDQLKKELAPEDSKRIVFFNTFADFEMVYWIQMVSDLFLMPSKFEPCGLTQIQAMVKGCLPVATATGGLADTIKDNKTGFLSEYDPDNLEFTKSNYCKTLDKALDKFYNNRKEFDQMSVQAIDQDFSWEGSGSLAKYLNLFKTGCTKG